MTTSKTPGRSPVSSTIDTLRAAGPGGVSGAAIGMATGGVSGAAIGMATERGAAHPAQRAGRSAAAQLKGGAHLDAVLEGVAELEDGRGRDVARGRDHQPGHGCR